VDKQEQSAMSVFETIPRGEINVVTILQNLELLRPIPEHEPSYLALVAELQRLGGEVPIGCLWSTFDKYVLAVRSFDRFLKLLREDERPEKLPPGIVPQTTFWLFDGNTIVGESRLRHCLDSSLEEDGGHISYAIVPSQRQKGYGEQILALTLKKAREFGLPRVLVTCNVDNVPSAKIIRKNGGILAGERISLSTGKMVMRYWIETER
jgi:predicted acetyltransferase